MNFHFSNKKKDGGKKQRDHKNLLKMCGVCGYLHEFNRVVISLSWRSKFNVQCEMKMLSDKLTAFVHLFFLFLFLARKILFIFLLTSPYIQFRRKVKASLLLGSQQNVYHHRTDNGVEMLNKVTVKNAIKRNLIFTIRLCI